MTTLDIAQLFISLTALAISLVALFVSIKVRKNDLELKLYSIASELKSDTRVEMERARRLHGTEVARQGASGTVVNSGSNKVIIDQLVSRGRQLDSIKVRIELVIQEYESGQIRTTEEAIKKLEELRGKIKILVAFLDREEKRLK